MRQLLLVASLLALQSTSAAAQFPESVHSGARVRVWLPESQLQDGGPWRRQLLRARVSSVDADTLRLVVPGIAGTLTIARPDIRRLDVSRGTSRPASAVERALAFAVVGALSAGIRNDPLGSEWPNYKTDWRAAGEGAKWGAAFGAVLGFAIPTERWRRVRFAR